MRMFPHKVTVLNRVEDDDGVSYIATVLSGVLYVTSRSSSRSTTGSDNKDDVKCTIPFNVSVDKEFIGKLEYDKLPINEKSKYWTLAKEDVIVKDVVGEDKISLKTLNSKYENKMVISFVDTLDFGSLKHWHVGGA